MPIIKMPDGQVVQLPDNMTPEQEAAAVARVELQQLKEFGDPARQDAVNEAIRQRESFLRKYESDNGGLLDKAKYYGSQAGSMIGRGLASVPAMAAGTANALANLYGPGNGKGFLENLTEPLQFVHSQGLAPQTEPEKYVGSAVEGAAGALAGPGKALLNATIGGAGGLGSEAGAHVTPNSPVGPLLGGLAAGLGTAGLSGLKRTREDLARTATRDVQPDALLAAEALQRRAKEQGVDLTLSQAMPVSSNLDKMVEELALSKHGVETARNLRSQPNQVVLAAQQNVGGLPGTIQSEQAAANGLQAAATQRLGDLKGQRQDLWEQTVRDGIKALQDSRRPAVIAARGKVSDLTAVQQKLEAELPGLRAAVEAAQAGDAAAVAAVNQRREMVQGLIDRLNSFQLPRGRTADNRGNLLDPSGRGFAIDADQINREVTASRLQQGLPPPVEPGKSLATTGAEKVLTGKQQAIEQVGGQLTDAKRGLAQATQAYNEVTTVPTQAVAKEISRLRQMAAQKPGTSIGTALNSLADALMPGGQPLRDPSQINAVLKEHAARLKMGGLNVNTPGMDAGAKKFVSGEIIQARDNLGTAFEPIQQGNKAFKEFTDQVYNPVKQGPVGVVAGKGAAPDANAAVQRALGVFEKGALPGGRSDILTLEGQLRRTEGGSEAFQTAAKSWLADKLGKAHVQEGGRPSESTAANIEAAFGRTEQQRQGFKDIMVGLARSQGLPDDSIYKGMRNFLEIVSAAAKRPQEVSGLSRVEIDQTSKNRVLSTVGGFSVIQPFRSINRAINDKLSGDAYGFMDKLLNDPDSVKTLIALGRQPVMSKAATNSVAVLVGVTASQPYSPGNTGQ